MNTKQIILCLSSDLPLSTYLWSNLFWYFLKQLQNMMHYYGCWWGWFFKWKRRMLLCLETPLNVHVRYNIHTICWLIMTTLFYFSSMWTLAQKYFAADICKSLGILAKYKKNASCSKLSICIQSGQTLVSSCMHYWSTHNIYHANVFCLFPIHSNMTMEFLRLLIDPW